MQEGKRGWLGCPGAALQAQCWRGNTLAPRAPCLVWGRAAQNMRAPRSCFCLPLRLCPSVLGSMTDVPLTSKRTGGSSPSPPKRGHHGPTSCSPLVPLVPHPTWLRDEEEEEGGGVHDVGVWGTHHLCLLGFPSSLPPGTMTPRSVATPLAQRVTSPAGPAPGFGHRSS